MSEEKQLQVAEKPKAELDPMQKLAGQLATSQMIPQRFQNKPRDLWVAMKTAQELGLQPITALRQIAVIQGTPSLFGDLPMALAQKSGHLDSFNEYFLDDSGKKICEENENLLAVPFAAVCRARRKDDSETYVSVFSVEDAKRAGLLPARGGSCWAKYQSDMMKYRARSRALKAVVPDALNGIAITEYDFHVSPDLQGNEKTITAADDYNSRYIGGESEVEDRD